MALPIENTLSASENIPPVRPAVADWIQEQTLQDEPSNGVTGPQRERVDGTAPRVGQEKQARADTNGHASRQEGCQPARKVYDIPTLLRLKETQSAVPVMLRVKPEAIAENIFQYMGAATSRRPPTRSRGLSDISNISTGNPHSYGNTIHSTARPKYMTQPLRQPHAPPESSILQRHDGFARFLKQHASPPHHRVTAGGRIVPAGPSSPPPMLDFGSLNGLVRDHPATAESFHKESHSAQPNARAQNPKATSSVTLGEYLRSQGGSADSMSFQHAAQSSSMQPTSSFNSVPFGYQPLMASTMQTQAPMVPVAMFPDGSTLVSYNGMNYRVSWNGTSMSMEPYQPLQLPVDHQYYPQAYAQGQINNAQYGVIPLPSVPSVPLASATNVARLDTSQAVLSLQREAQNDDGVSLRAQLTDLDKHLALYHYDITPANRASLIAQRRRLVEEIDRIRLSKEKPKHKIPIIAPAAAELPATPAVPNALRTRGSSMNKHLSPAAPAFVPRNASSPLPNSFGMRTASQQYKHENFGIRVPSGGISSAPKVQENEKSSAWMSHPDHTTSLSIAQNTSHNDKSSSSSVLDPSDPAMRVIEYEDIEYAARYLYNWTKDTKTYCTTVAEFQEAVRRVREQARLYGCAGGQSKDPAYDAEQDLWWAICDRDPIPLPSKVPDHVTNPRPWNWNDSAFNYRRQGANDTSVPGCEQAHNSPRVLGWDPATTDKNKDEIDVSRSYFALNGRLPSVSFRDFAYDRDGNKRLVQSDTATSAAYIADSKKMIHLDQSTVAGSQQNCIENNSSSSGPKEMSTSELNIQRKGSASKAQLKTVDKPKASEIVSQPPGIPRTPENRRVQQLSEASNVNSAVQILKKSLTTRHGITDPRSYETLNDSHPTHIEDYPETPKTRGTRSASKGVLTQIKATSSQARMDPLSIDNSVARNGSPTQVNIPDGTGVLGTNWNPTEDELNSIWYHTPLDEVTQKYIDDMKAYNPLNDKQDGENKHGVIAAGNQVQVSDSSEPVTESKSPWGPEEGFTPRTPSSRCLLEYTNAEEHRVSRTARVNIPNASTLRAPIPRTNDDSQRSADPNVNSALDARELSAVNIPTLEGKESHYFLRKMLKSPRYSSAEPRSLLSQISSTLANRINGTKHVPVSLTEQQSENKGNTQSYKFGNTGNFGSGPSANRDPPSSISLAGTVTNLTVSKAQSSLASSTYQAHGYLPQFEGAGKAQTSTVYRDQGIQPLPHVRLPSEALYGEKNHAPEASSNQTPASNAYTTPMPYHNPVYFGYDGGRDSPPSKTTNVPRDQQSAGPTFDYMGVTLADYDNRREDTNNDWHHGAVDDFFQDLREQELRTIQSHHRVNTQSAA